MTEKEQEILDMYLKDLRKKRVITVLLIICISIIGLSYAKNFIENENQQEISVENKIEENITNEMKLTNEIENTVETTKENKEENQIPNGNIVKENKPTNDNQEIKEEAKKKMKIFGSNYSNERKEGKPQQVSVKPNNRDFLFTDGYTMENVTQAAQDYLSSSGHTGECTPIKDNEGIYLGMRVTFY